MTWLAYLQKLYSLDTLDTRFTTSPKTPLKSDREDSSIANSKLPAQEILSSGQTPKSLANAQPSKWNTAEFYFYYLCFLTLVPLMTKAVYDVSKREPNPCESHTNLLTCGIADSPNYDRYSHLLSDGWIPGRKVVGQMDSAS